MACNSDNIYNNSYFEMERLIILLVVGVLIAELIAQIDAIISGLKQTSNESKKRHRLGFYLRFVIALIVAYLYNGISLESGLVLLYVGSLFLTYFPIRLNRLRTPKKPYFYLSKTGVWDKHFVENKKLYFTVAFLLLFGSATILIRTVL